MLYKIAQIILRIILKLLFKVRIHINNEYEYYDKKCIICSNHISMFDPVVIGAFYKRQIHFMAKRELFKNKFFNLLFNKLGAIPVDRKGLSYSAIKSSLKILNDNNILGIFPEGTRVRDYDINNVKPGIAMLAYKSNSEVMPVYIDSKYKFRSEINVYFGDPKNYFSKYDEKPNNELYMRISKDILSDIYKLKKNGD